jgi:preprotein translocase SecE subunit
MANPIIQYFKETRSELNHVAWPTQNQTIVYTILVAAISLGVAAYLGALDYGFTTALTDVVNASGNANAQSAIQVTQQPVASTSAPTAAGQTFTVTPNTTPASGNTPQ